MLCVCVSVSLHLDFWIFELVVSPTRTIVSIIFGMFKQFFYLAVCVRFFPLMFKFFAFEIATQFCSFCLFILRHFARAQFILFVLFSRSYFFSCCIEIALAHTHPKLRYCMHGNEMCLILLDYTPSWARFIHGAHTVVWYAWRNTTNVARKRYQLSFSSVFLSVSYKFIWN